MPDLPISGLPAVTEPAAGDLYAIVSGGVTSKVSRANNSKIITDSTAKTANYTLTANDEAVKFDTSSGNLTAFLPTAVGIKGKWYSVIKVSASNTLTVEPDGSETINGSLNYAITANNSVITFQSDGANWFITSIGVQGAGNGDVVGPGSSTDNALVRFDGTTGKLIQNSVGTLTDGGTLDVANAILDYLQIDTAATAPAIAEGTFAWDSGNGTAELGLKGGNVSLKVGQQEYVRVYNDTASTMTKGQVVYIFGAQGNRVSVKLARADAEATAKNTLGFVAESITAGGEGFVLSAGSLYNLNTNSLTAGDTVYLSPTTAGDYTTTKPSAPNHTVILGFVQRVSATVGIIFTKVDNGYEIDELHDVAITSPANGQLLIRDQTAGVWENAYLTAGSNITITNAAGAITIASSGGGGGVSDGDKGDITVSGSGATWTIDNGAVTLAKQADVATSSVFYRKTAGTGSPEVQTLSTLKTDLGLTGTNSGDQTITLTGNVTGSGTGSFAATIANDAVTTAKILNANVTYAKIQDVTNNRLLGRANAVNGTIQEISLGSNLSFSGQTLNATTFQKVITSGTASPSGGIDGDIYLQYV